MDPTRLQRALFAELAAKLPQWDLFENEGVFERVLGTVSWRLKPSLLDNPAGFDVIADVAVEHHQHGQCVCVVGAELGGDRACAAAALAPRSAGRRARGGECAAQATRRHCASVPHALFDGAGDLAGLRTSPEEARVIRPFVTDPAAEAAAIEARWSAP